MSAAVTPAILRPADATAARVRRDLGVDVLVIVLTLASGLAILLDAPPAVRLPLVVLFVGLGPGLALLPRRGAGSRPDADALVLVATVGAASAVLIAEAMALTGTWSLGTGYAALATLCLGGVAVRRARARRGTRAPGRGPSETPAATDAAPIRNASSPSRTPPQS